MLLKLQIQIYANPVHRTWCTFYIYNAIVCDIMLTQIFLWLDYKALNTEYHFILKFPSSNEIIHKMNNAVLIEILRQ